MIHLIDRIPLNLLPQLPERRLPFRPVVLSYHRPFFPLQIRQVVTREIVVEARYVAEGPDLFQTLVEVVREGEQSGRVREVRVERLWVVSW